LGNRFFEYPVTEATASLLPEGKVARTVIMPDSLITLYARKVGVRADYKLTQLLIDRKLKMFAAAVVVAYPDSLMPKHYAEALVLYKGIKREEGYGELDSLKIDDGVKVDYNDFLAMMRAKKPMLQKQADIRDNYFGTYWYFYFRK
jgi:hypothetical protein